MNKYIKNVGGNEADFYVYGDIVDERYPDFWTGEKSETEVDPMKLKEELDELKDVSDLNVYINSGGGSVFASSTMVSMLKRLKTDGVRIHAFIDGLCASASTYLFKVADDMNIYQNSIMMIHKPMTITWGNADELQKDINTLNTIENDMMIPMYMSKARDGISEDDMRQLVADETWFSGNKDDDMYIGNFFKVNLIDEARPVVASASKLFGNYKHVPDALKRAETPTDEAENDAEEDIASEEINTETEAVAEYQAENIEDVVIEEPMIEPIDYAEFENIIQSLKEMT